MIQENNLMKSIQTIIKDRQGHWVGDGFPVRTIFSYSSLREGASPFLLMDYAGPAYFEPSDKIRGVEQHPHRGFETVTIVYQGELEHRDTAGGYGKIKAGGVQWMTAASGIVHEEMHSEAFTRTGGTLEMIQLWVNLPAKDKMSKPHYQDITRELIPEIKSSDNKISIRIIAGDYQGVTGPAKTFTPINLWDLRMQAGTKLELTLPENHNASLFLLSGRMQVNETTELTKAELVVFNQGQGSIIIETEEDSVLLVMSGEPIQETIVGYGPFVMNTKEEIEQAKEDYHSGKMGQL